MIDLINFKLRLINFVYILYIYYIYVKMLLSQFRSSCGCHGITVTPTGRLQLQGLPQSLPVWYLEATIEYMLTKCCKNLRYDPEF